MNVLHFPSHGESAIDVIQWIQVRIHALLMNREKGRLMQRATPRLHNLFTYENMKPHSDSRVGKPVLHIVISRLWDSDCA